MLERLQSRADSIGAWRRGSRDLQAANSENLEGSTPLPRATDAPPDAAPDQTASMQHSATEPAERSRWTSRALDKIRSPFRRLKESASKSELPHGNSAPASLSSSPPAFDNAPGTSSSGSAQRPNWVARTQQRFRDASAPVDDRYDKSLHLGVYWEADVPEQHKHGAIHVRLVKDLAQTYYWSGEFNRDYVFFIRNWHPLISILLCHPHHPWKKSQRLVMFLMTVGMTCWPFVLKMRIDDDQSTDASDKNINYAAVYLFVTLPIMLIGYLLYYLSIAHLACTCNGCLGCLCAPCQLCMRCYRKMTFLAWSFVAIAMFACAMIVAVVDGVDLSVVINGVLISQLQSWLTWFPIMFVMPCVGFPHGWYMEKRAQEELGNSGSNNVVPDVENNIPSENSGISMPDARNVQLLAPSAPPDPFS